jgi:hypothetical protein
VLLSRWTLAVKLLQEVKSTSWAASKIESTINNCFEMAFNGMKDDSIQRQHALRQPKDFSFLLSMWHSIDIPNHISNQDQEGSVVPKNNLPSTTATILGISVGIICLSLFTPSRLPKII